MFSFMEGPDQNEYKEVCSSIVPGMVYLSGYHPANNRALLDELAITHVIQIGDLNDFNVYVNHDGITYKTIVIKDSVRSHFTVNLLNDAVAFIKAATSPVLVHCRAGVSRSATVIMAYMISVHKMSYREAKMAVKEKRPCVSPNTTFLRDLVQFAEVHSSSMYSVPLSIQSNK